jgi:Mrp family chromosome partitioning ATPase
MSTIDQAFIRAYQERLAKGTVMPAAPAAAPRLEPENSRHDDARAVQPQPTARIDVAADAAIPPPHADFAKVENAVSQATGELAKAAFGQSPKAALSSFTETSSGSGSSAAFFKPALEVDSVCWPPICERLVSQFRDHFDSTADEIHREAERHCKVVAVSGLARSEGRTTLVLCLARCLAARAKVAIIDGDFTNPCLSHQLGIGPESGWETVLLGNQQLAEITIQSAADRIALVPLVSAVASREAAQLSYRIAVSLAELADHYDLVLVDAGPMSGEVANRFVQPSSGVQGIILTHDVRRGEASRLVAACLDIAVSNQNLMGIAETFAS